MKKKTAFKNVLAIISFVSVGCLSNCDAMAQAEKTGVNPATPANKTPTGNGNNSEAGKQQAITEKNKLMTANAPANNNQPPPPVFFSAGAPAFITDSIENYIKNGLQQWQVPGLAIVIIKDGRVVLQKGYGNTAIKDGQPVDANTLFFIASNSKLFTGTALAHLENLGKLSLNDKITKYYPNFKLYDKTSTELVSIRDMLSHRIGTKTFQGDFTFWNTNLSRDEIMNRMQYLKPVNPFRQDYGYCNSCFLTAGQIIPKVTGRQWEDFITDSLLKPLAMNNSYDLSNGIEKKQSNIAKPYTTSFTNKLTQVPYDVWDNLGPAPA